MNKILAKLKHLSEAINDTFVFQQGDLFYDGTDLRYKHTKIGYIRYQDIPDVMRQIHSFMEALINERKRVYKIVKESEASWVENLDSLIKQVSQ